MIRCRPKTDTYRFWRYKSDYDAPDWILGHIQNGWINKDQCAVERSSGIIEIYTEEAFDDKFDIIDDNTCDCAKCPHQYMGLCLAEDGDDCPLDEGP